jgi:(p)ppGpp synthase/HD superfamily hydrolase
MRSELEEQARKFATAAHARVDQKRKYTNAPYITHPAAVVEIMRSVPHTEEMLAAAWLHDTVEDTGTKLIEIRVLLGRAVADLVEWLTDVSKPEDGQRSVRKRLDLEHIAQAPADAQTVKLADLIDNSRSILERDPSFARVYLAEKRMLLQVLTRGDKTLYKMAQAIVEKNAAAFTTLARELSRSSVKKLERILEKSLRDKGLLEASLDANHVVWVTAKEDSQVIALLTQDVWDGVKGVT